VSNFLTNQYVVTFAVFGMFATLAWFVLERLAAGKSRAAVRLDEIRNPSRKRSDASDSLMKKQDAMSRVLEATSPAIAKTMQPKSEEEQGKLKSRLCYAGFRGENAMAGFLGIKVISLGVGILLGGGGGLLASGGTVSQKALVIGIFTAFVFMTLPDLVLSLMIRKRQKAVFLSLPDVLDLMVVCVEAGLGLDQAMRRVAEELRTTYPVICEELDLCNFHLQMGRARTEVLHELGARTGVSDLKSLAGILIQADKFGSSIAQALRVQSDAMRTRRSQLAEEKAAKTAVKLIFPLVIFIFPGIFVVLVGPAAIKMTREMFDAMN